jgi:Protein of unknown function (DUF3616)
MALVIRCAPVRRYICRGYASLSARQGTRKLLETRIAMNTDTCNGKRRSGELPRDTNVSRIPWSHNKLKKERFFLSLVIVMIASRLVWSAELQPTGKVEFTGDIKKSKDISALCLVGEFLVIGADEGNKIQILKRDGDHYGLVRDVVLDDSAKEIDVEGIACDGNTVYVVGSHSWKRESVKDNNTYKDNRELIAAIQPEPSRDRVFKFTVDSEGNTSAIEKTSLRAILDQDKVLHPFSRVPSKENGIDIEGLAFHQGLLYAGSRGPVLRDNYVPVLTFQFATPVVQANLLFVNLGGRGIRDLAAVQGGFLVLAGPVGDGPGSYQVYFWNGQDCLPGRRDAGEVGQCRLLGEVRVEPEAKAEGITVVAESASVYEVIIVYDGSKNGDATRFRMPKL